MAFVEEELLHRRTQIVCVIQQHGVCVDESLRYMLCHSLPEHLLNVPALQLFSQRLNRVGAELFVDSQDALCIQPGGLADAREFGPGVRAALFELPESPCQCDLANARGVALT